MMMKSFSGLRRDKSSDAINVSVLKIYLLAERKGYMDKRPVKEPIRKKWIWIVLGLILIGNVPWYFPAGSIEPLILGVPYWAFIVMLFSLVLCGYLSYLCAKQWDIVEEEEEAGKEVDE